MRICDATGGKYTAENEHGGLLLPLFDETGWPWWLRAFLYLLGLIWSFLGVGIVSDIFMMAIEVITAQERTVTLEDGAVVSVKVWNSTVANLSLMALGSSAPEILLSVVEIIGAEFFSGELGPSTIVGSAAFNLLMIIGVCVVALPDGEERKIDDLNVYYVTAFFSIFAYLWLVVALLDDKVDIWEGVFTFLCFPILVGTAFAADRGYFSSARVTGIMPSSYVVEYDGMQFMPHQAERLVKAMQEKQMSEEEQAQMLAQFAQSNQKTSYAQRRMEAIRKMTGKARKIPPKGNKDLADQLTSLSGVSSEKAAEPIEADKKQVVFFGTTAYAVVESDKKVVLQIKRSSGDGTVTAFYETVSDQAEAGKDFKFKKDKVVFGPGETEKSIEIEIIDDDEVEEDELFKVQITKIEATGEAEGAKLANSPEEALVTIIDDDKPGKMGFRTDNTSVTCSETQKFVEVTVSRIDGSAGEVSCKVSIEALTAVEGVDYEPLAEDFKVSFSVSQVNQVVQIPIIDQKKYEKNAKFKVVLSDPEGVRAEMADYTECVVMITADEETKKLVNTVTQLANMKLRKYQIGTSTWIQQFREAFDPAADLEDEDHDLTTSDYVMHAICLPWKLFYAIIPPTDYLGGKVCFFFALGFIGITTVFIGDLAAIFGCIITLKEPVVAITFVALGTSLPDTFASMAAAQADDNADASIVNVTGSNSVNVFLGLGLPWLIASLYWNNPSETAMEDWKVNYPYNKFKNVWDDAETPSYKFVVPAGNLSISVATFCFCAFIALGTLFLRRKYIGAELGGPKKSAKQTFALFSGLWLFYVLISALNEYGIIFS